MRGEQTAFGQHRGRGEPVSVDPLGQFLADNRYPGRGVLWARTRAGELVGGYFLTGRSPASQARRLHFEDERLIVSPTDETAHDPLRHYAAAIEDERWLVFGNGEQVATVAGRLAAGEPPAVALDRLEYEPDPPILTSRITVVADLADPGTACLGAARRSAGARAAGSVVTVTVRDLAPGDVVMMTTYRSDGGTVLPAEPYAEATTEAADAAGFLDEMWRALTPELRVAAAAFTPGRLTGAALRHRTD
ncbi:hypothetical protein FH609_014000 [Streptomyces sp. 3MP-14]|uniref:Inosine monophosphate cyclohydrolase-like domain-containing protein n=1 Tax=Streptomyces mimosae TaxID=2586635 RepID=A0A5N6A8R3_9ACTN|nr:hypothetical protein FH607_016890 [Streptomyces mimosae]KAB8176586.1 hypothetical protein FH609_014000 [Streptomyces sp. 3MP-14]